MKIIYPVLILAMTSYTVLIAQNDDQPVRILKKHNAPVRAMAFSNDGQTLATGGDDKMIFLWDLKTGEPTGSIDNYFIIRYLQFTPDNSILAACGSDIKLMDREGKLFRTFKGYTTDIWSMDYNPQIHMLIAGSYAKSIKVWNFDNGSLQLTLSGHEKSCLPVKINMAGDLAASGSLDKSVRLWDMATGAELKKLEIHSENIFSVDFHPSGKYLASASADKTIRLWNVKTGKVIRTYLGHQGNIFDVEFSADGNHLLSCGSDKSIILWETATGKLLHVFSGHSATVNAVRFSKDNRSFASASDDHTVRIWNLERKYFIDPYFGKDIEEAKQASPLFAPRSMDETKQAYASRVQEAEIFLNNICDQYFEKYCLMISRYNLEEPDNNHEQP